MKQFFGDLGFTMGVAFTGYAIAMTGLSLVEGGISAEEYGNGVRPAVEQVANPHELYLPRINN